MYGSAFGRFNYIYRAKGDRVIWFSSGKIGVYSIYSTMDENGFEYSCSELSSMELFPDEENNKISEEELMDLDIDLDLNDMKTLLKGLVNIKQQYNRDYALEYLLDPPDVNIVSDFSIKLKSDIWDSIMLLGQDAIFAENDNFIQLFKYVTELMQVIKVEPSPVKIIELLDYYIKYKDDIETVKMNMVMDAIKSMTTSTDKCEEIFINENEFINNLNKISLGINQAAEYQKFIFNAVQKIFDTTLRRPKYEEKVNEGRKRIDIVFDNTGNKGFFSELKSHYNIFCPKIFIECKNYRFDPENKELDQLIGRFSDRYGKFGILICRNVVDEKLMLLRCKDVLNNGQGRILILSDTDIIKLINLRAKNDLQGINDYMRDKHDKLIL